MRSSAVLFHSPCIDGLLAAVVAYKALKGYAVFYPHNPAIPFDLDTLDSETETIYLLDYCGPPGFLEKCMQRAKVVLLDHHDTAAKMVAALPETGNHFLAVHQNSSGCMMANRFWNPIGASEVNWDILSYVEDDDLWRHKLPDSRTFAAGMRSIPWNYSDIPAASGIIDSLSVSKVIELGEQQLQKESQAIEQALATSYKLQLGDQIYWAAETSMPEITSSLGERLAQKETGYGAVVIRGDRIKLSLRSISDDHDTTVFSASKGGGGHKRSSGCFIDEAELHKI
jgi:oligoribonuclease NrnB/cAMP/cGMP phosphodiesterase (DHH superfamily)